MQYVKLGSTGMDVSRICLGCMSYGDPRPGHPPVVARRGGEPSRSSSRPIEAGINFFDTANVYSDGTSEEIVGRALADVRRPRRDRAGDEGARPDAPRPERRRPVAQGDHDRDRRQPAPPRHRLRRPLPDPPLGPARRRSRRRWRRCTTSSRPARPATSAPRRCTPGSSPRPSTSPIANGWTPFVTMQNHYNLLYREEEREMLPLCADLGRRRDPVEPAGPRPPDPRLGRDDGPQRDRRVRQDALPRRRRGDRRRRGRRSPSSAASAGPRSRWPGCRGTRPSTPRSSAPPSRDHLDDAVASLDVELTDDEVADAGAPLHPPPDRRLRLTGTRLPVLNQSQGQKWP